MKSARFKRLSLHVPALPCWCHAGCFLFSLWCLLVVPSVSAAPQQHKIDKQINILRPYQSHIQKRLSQFSPLVNRIFSQLDEKSLPSSLVLVPMLESSFDASAVSHANAAGLWQLIPATARRFGLRVDGTNDQRFDSQASTQAALKYLQFLYNKFDQDLALTLAAYNAGEGRVARAVKRAGTREFAKLPLPQETRQYVQRFYALKTLVDISKLQRSSFRPLFLYAGNTQDNQMPLVDFSPLPPLISL
ncbi:lytic transglycosylase domain-containing protein [Vibrio sp. CAU 1672]|uniref:lytic transglycosylase domain-containing protein n=1 Tax=Vibrio sp. CAU 1672 TaxID=3032594 RepID=UPI0023DC9F94|nr:lytic transglycosylase domain-containing protein [Vibrio sp. CAU 1672]MDF2152579.1 lytic transglycosylase domain-containing protein [Vibrio sp. CAU 1672]